jgi:cyanate permease
MFVGILLLIFLPASPEQPKPLFPKGLIRISSREGILLQQRIATESPKKIYRSQHLSISPRIVWKTLCHWRRWPHLLATSLVFSTWSPLTTYTPTIVMSLGFSRTPANALASVGPFISLPIVFLFAVFSDRTNARGLAVFLAIICYLITLIVLRTTEAHVGKWSRWGLWTVVNSFAIGYHPVHNTWLQLNCEGPEDRSVSMA